MAYEKLVKYRNNIETIVKICYYKNTHKEVESDKMINDEICRLRNELNNSIVRGEDYDKIYKISIELDELITEYYLKEKRTKKEDTTYNGKITILA